MRIILTVHQFFPHYSSGTEVLTYESAKELQNQGHAVSVFTAVPTQDKPADGERFGRYTYEGIPVEYFYYDRLPMGDQANPVQMEYNNLFVRSYFSNYLQQEMPDIVHFFHLAHLSASPINACIDLGIPTVYTPTDFWFICPMYQLMYPGNQICPGPDEFGINCMHHLVENSQSLLIGKIFHRIPKRIIEIGVPLAKRIGRFEKRYSPLISALSERQSFLQKEINLVDRIVIPTKVMQSNLVKYGLDEKRIINLPFGINIRYIQNIQRAHSDGVLRLGYIGTLLEHKGAHVLIKAMALLADKPITLKIYGKLKKTQAYNKMLIKLAKEDSRIEFCGTFPNSDIGRVFSELDALVVPSLWYENSPLVIYSAQLARCPVIASDMAGMAEIIRHGENGLLFEPGNVAKLAETIISILENPDYLRRLSDNAPQTLSIQEYVTRLLEVYKSLLKEELEK